MLRSGYMTRVVNSEGVEWCLLMVGKEIDFIIVTILFPQVGN